MRNVVLPQSLSEVYSYGYDEAVSSIPFMMQNELSFCESSIWMDSNLYTKQDQVEDVLSFCTVDPIHYHSGIGSMSLMTIKRNPSLGNNHLSTLHTQQTLPEKNFSVSQNEKVIKKSRKISIGNIDDTIAEKSSNDSLISDKSKVITRPTSHKMKRCFQDQFNYNQDQEVLKDIQKERVPVRRSQKLTDKITALQKLVSPYGKADTASVLHEAYISIKALQDQIQNLCNIPSTYHNNADCLLHSQISKGKENDVQSKGLCLVPVSLAKRITKEDFFNKSL